MIQLQRFFYWTEFLTFCFLLNKIFHKNVSLLLPDMQPKPGLTCHNIYKLVIYFFKLIQLKQAGHLFQTYTNFIMRHFMPFIIVFLLTACTKENAQDSQIHLLKTTVNGKTHENFEYNNNGQLKKEDSYNFCTVPSDEFIYVYKNNQLDSIKSVVRSIYSSSTAICNPQSGIHSYSAFEYDNLGRISKIKKENSTIEYSYNSVGQIEKQTMNGGGTNQYVSTFKYDDSGNLVEATDSQRNITQYEFDNKINPYFLMKRSPDVLIAFYISPNNVVKIKNPGIAAIEIRYEYNVSKMPVKMFDPNGLSYLYIYN